MAMRMMLPVSVLLGAGSLGCSLQLDFSRFEFTSADGSVETDSSGLQERAADPQQEAAVRCAAGDSDCVGERGPISAPRAPRPVDAGGLGSGPSGADAADPSMPAPVDAGDSQPAPASCAALKASDPTLPDGIYLVSTGGSARRTYCDMTAGVALCSEDISEHDGVTRDASHLAFTLTAVLEGSRCRVWNVRARQDGRPLDGLVTGADGGTVRPCTPLGFRSDPAGYDIESGCRYGQNPGHGTCGFNVTRPLRKWANLCTCDGPDDVGGGFFMQYVLQGTIFVSHIPWDATGAVSVSCGT